jgi:phospholipid/cholesterol/gamma-HCH transport system substrate-binding protein
MEIKVGVFLLVCIALVAGLVIKFGKLERFSARSYNITVVFPNVAGIVRDANVMYAGISVGKVRDIKLSEEGEFKVRVTLAIYEGYTIRKDAQFVINQTGLLGDRYVDVVPRSASAEPIKAGEEVQGMSSVDLTEAMRSVVDVLRQTAGTIARIDEAVRRTDQAIKRFDEVVLTTQNLEHVSSTLVNLDAATSNAVGAISSLQSVIHDSRQSISNTLNTLSVAADDLGDASKRVQKVVTDNEDEVHAAAKDLAASMAKLNSIMEGVQKGQGTAGRLLTDPTLHDEILKLVENWRRYGILYKDKNAGKTETPKPKQ